MVERTVGGTAGAELAWSGLEELRPGLRRFLRRRTQDENDIDDIIQETLLRAARYRGSHTHSTRLGSWVTRIASNVLRDHLVRARRRPSVGHDEELIEALEDRAPSPGQLSAEEGYFVGVEYVDKAVLCAHLARAFAGLLEHDRRILSSYYAGCQDARSTASACGIAPPLVKVRLFRARRRLERALLSRVCQRRVARLFSGTLLVSGVG